MNKSYHQTSSLNVSFDDNNLVADSGLALAGILSQKLQLSKLAEEIVNLGDTPGRPNPGRKILTIVHSMMMGANFMDDCDILRSGSTEKVLGHRVMAPSTIGIFLRSFTFGHVNQLNKLSSKLLANAWAMGAGPGSEPFTIDMDSTITQVYGKQKQGAAYGYTKALGYHPLIATRASTGEILHIINRKGSAHTGRGADKFLTETIRRIRQAKATGEITLRADSGFFSKYVFKACNDKNVKYSITAKLDNNVKKAISSIEESSWVDIEYTENGDAQVAEVGYGENQRLIVRRTHIDELQDTLFPYYRYHAFVTNRQKGMVELDEDHRNHAVVELAIKDLKEGSGLCHMPSGKFNANSAWSVLASIAHNMIRWTAKLGLNIKGPVVVKTIRNRFFRTPGRIATRSRQIYLHMPTKWPWAQSWIQCYKRLNSIVLIT